MADFYKVVYQDGENIFEAGANAGNLYILMDGCVELVGSDGKAFAEVPRGQSFGEQAFLRGGIRGAGARAKGVTTCAKIAAEDAAAMLANASPLLVHILEALLMQQNMNNTLRRPL
jgi:CRP-like cAMP-binding protein